MPRAPRQKSQSGIYHIMLRGINQQIIFEDDEDYQKFIEILKNYKTVSGYKIFAYCLMSNHIHLLLKVVKEDIDQVMKRIAGSYVYWYNWKYYRKGHLFQDRFKSEPVEDDTYLLTVIRYIHQNPVKANIVKNVSNYEYSSYDEYIGASNTLIDRDFALSILNKENFIKYHNKINEDVCLDISENEFRLSDNDAKEIIKKISGCSNVSEFQALEYKKRDKYISKLKEKGLSIRQISRLTGVSFAVVRKI